MAKVVMLIAGASVEPHKSNEYGQRQTWAKDFSSPVYWLHGNNQVAKGPKSGAVEVADRRINVDLAEGFTNLLEKTLRSLAWALRNHDFDFAVRSNTSSFWNDHHLLLLLERLPARNLYAGPIGTWLEADDSWDYVGGSALFMSRDIAELAARANAEDYRHLPDDVALGHWMRENGIKPVALVGGWVSDYEPVLPGAFCRLKHWTRPRITRARMRRLDRIYRQQWRLGVLAALAHFNLCEVVTVALDPGQPPAKALRLIVRNVASWPEQARSFLSRPL